MPDCGQGERSGMGDGRGRTEAEANETAEMARGGWQISLAFHSPGRWGMLGMRWRVKEDDDGLLGFSYVAP